ncbi:MAG: hypothetical protein F6J95_025240 [Leptolyngbya sp. SIO1E4]|nr:hypothetical protein [Leptolyngbya sp. SIO1E4]
MSLLPNQMNFELIFRAWLHTQITQLSVDVLRAGVFVRIAHFDFHDTEYLIEYQGKVTHCSPEEAYAMLKFYLALDDLEKREKVGTSTIYPF